MSTYTDVIKEVPGNTGFQPKVTISVRDASAWRGGEKEVGLSWPAYGEVSIEFAEKMAEALNEAISKAKKEL